MFKLIRGGEVFAPEKLGQVDILTAAGKIVAMGPELIPPAGCRVEEISAQNAYVTPCLLDIHVHIIGGGGEGGPDSRAPEISAEKIFKAGVGTVLGMLGTDDVTRHPESLLAKAQGLERQGVTAFILAGSYKYPQVHTVTGDLRKDITLIPHIIGVGEIALADHRGPQAGFRDLAKLAAEARVGGLLGDKPGLVVVHMGGGKEGMDQLFRLIEETEIPQANILPTHITRTQSLLEQGARWASLGGNLDITAHATESKGKITLGEALDFLRQKGVDPTRISVSSDSNGSIPRFDEDKNFIGWSVGDISDLRTEFLRLVGKEKMPPEKALTFFTQNPAKRIGVSSQKGALALDMDADLVVWDKNWQVQTLLTDGKIRLMNGELVG